MELTDLRLIYAHFELNPEYKQGTDVSMDLGLELSHDYIDAENVLKFTLSAELKGNGAPVVLKLSMGSLFKFEKKPDTSLKLGQIAEINCASIVFPFVREAMADLTRRAGLQPIILQPINFVDFYNNNHPDSSIELSPQKK